MDIFIDGFEPLTSVPIELSGVRSYEIQPEDDNPDIGHQWKSQDKEDRP